MSTYRDRLAEAMRGHYIAHDKTDAMGNEVCVCGDWADGKDADDWDQHMAGIAAVVRDAELDTLSTENDRLAAEVKAFKRLAEVAKAAHEQTVDRLGEVFMRAERAETELSEAKAELRYDSQLEAELVEAQKKIKDLSSSLDRVREVVDAGYGTDTDDRAALFHLGQQDMAARVRVFLPPAINPPPGDTP